MAPRPLFHRLPLLPAVAIALYACAPAQVIPQAPSLAAVRVSAPAPSKSAPLPGSPDLAAYTIPQTPEWTDKYINSDPQADVRYFRIKKLMTDFALSRFQAIELQNHYRDLTRVKTAPAQAFAEALAAVRAGRTGSGVDLEKLRTAPFIVVLDLDETLYQRSPSYRSGSTGLTWRDFSFQAGTEESFVKLRPGWEQAIRRLRALGGMVILFTASPDQIAEGVTSKWLAGGAPILTLVDGLLSKSHLVLQEKSDGDPIVLPSKDLRIFDESLERVIIVDDNPKLIVQHHRHRLIKKFQADPYLAAKLAGRGPAAPFEAGLPAIVNEIEESLQYGTQHHVALGPAYLPYTLLGSVAMEALIQGGMTPAAARLYIRQNPGFVDERF